MSLYQCDECATLTKDPPNDKGITHCERHKH